MAAIGSEETRTNIRLEGVFDIEAARRLAAQLEDAVYADVRIDMTRVREFHDFAVALLAENIAGRKAPTAVFGLQEHHRRLLRHLGIGSGSSGASAD
jgi:ABC-type transporter Mla MlaB component